MARGATGTTKSRKTGPKARSGMMSASTVKNPQPVDRHVGSRVRMRRMMVGMSQEKLGEACGDHIPANSEVREGNEPDGGKPPPTHIDRSVLDVPIEFFYEGSLDTNQGSNGPIHVDGQSRSMTEFLATSAGPRAC